MVLKTLVKFAAGKRIPLIKFRKGGPAVSGSAAAGQQSAQASASPTSSSKSSGAASKGLAIEDWQLPSRYWRKPIDAAEMDYINRGGPA